MAFWRSSRMPVILQGEAAECGAACLAMVLSFWGDVSDMRSVRGRFGTSLRGVSLRTLASAAEGMGLTARSVRVELESLKHLQLPCVLHWNMNHFVVLQSVGKKHVVIHDPALGRLHLSMNELSSHFTGIALELSPNPSFRTGTSSTSIGVFGLFGRMIGLKRSLLGLASVSICLQLCLLATPLFLQLVVDESIESGDIDMPIVLGCGFVALLGLQTLMQGLRTWFTATLAASINGQWFGNVLDHLLRVPLEYFQRRHLGDIASRVLSMEEIQKWLTSKLVETVVDVVLCVAAIALMFSYSVPMASISLLSASTYFLLRHAWFSTLRQLTSENIAYAAKQHGHLLETIRGIETVRVNGGELERRQSWLGLVVRQFNAGLSMTRRFILLQSANSILFGIDRVVVICIGARAAIESTFSVGMLFGYLAFRDIFIGRISVVVE